MAGPVRVRADVADAVVRPAPHRWIWYALGGGLPDRHRRWVLHDTTTGTWWLRHVARVFVQMAVPIALVLIVLPAPFGLRAAAAGGGIFLALIYALAYMPEAVENRVVKAGYPVGTGERGRVTSGEPQQSTIESVDPAVGSGRWKRERYQTEARFSAHRRDVAQAARQRLVSHLFGPVCRVAEVDSVEQQIRSEKQILALPDGPSLG